MALLPHDYVSDACHHDFHDYCKGYVTLEGESRLVKTVGHCKYCASGCRCECHIKVTKVTQ